MSETLRPYRIVSIGGGTGLSALLHGLKKYVPAGGDAANSKSGLPPIDITAVVTVTDDGGSSGRLRRDFEVLPPGDIRNCMVALSEDEDLLTRLFQYRFETGRGLKGHSFGNLFLTALTHITGDFHRAVQVSSEVLRIVGSIYPSTGEDVILEALLADGTSVVGESRISRSKGKIQEIRLQPRRCKPLPETLAAIESADLITLGPGSLFTSVIPNLLVEGIADAIRASHAVTAYMVNLMWQPGETSRFRASDHIDAIIRHAGPNLVDYAIVNIKPVPLALRRKYALAKARPVEVDYGGLAALGVEVVAGNLLHNGDVVRHDPARVAAIAVQLAREGRLRRELAMTEAKRLIWKAR